MDTGTRTDSQWSRPTPAPSTPAPSTAAPSALSQTILAAAIGGLTSPERLSAWHTASVQRDRDPIEDRAADAHRRIAERIRREPNVIGEARTRLEQRIAREGSPADPVLCEWLDVLLMLDPPQVADFIESATPRARRLRISSPLVWLSR